MYAITVHRDREARHSQHLRIDCLASAPAGVKAKSRRSVRAAGKAALHNELAEALADRAAGIDL